MKKVDGKLKEFFNKVLDIPCDVLKEFIFDKKKYIKGELSHGNIVFWHVYEWGDFPPNLLGMCEVNKQMWIHTSKIILTDLLSKNNCLEDWILECDSNDDFHNLNSHNLG